MEGIEEQKLGRLLRFEKERKNYFKNDMSAFSYFRRSGVFELNEKAKEFVNPKVESDLEPQGYLLPEIAKLCPGLVKKIEEILHKPKAAGQFFSFITQNIETEKNFVVRCKKIWSSQKDAECSSIVGRFLEFKG